MIKKDITHSPRKKRKKPMEVQHLAVKIKKAITDNLIIHIKESKHLMIIWG